MKCKLKRRLRLKIALLTFIVFVCGFLLGLIAQRPKKEFTASANVTNTVNTLPYFGADSQISIGNPFDYYFDSSLYGVEISFVCYWSPSNINLNFQRRTSSGGITSLSNGDTFTVNSSSYFRVLNQTGTAVTFHLNFVLANPVTLSTPSLGLSGNVLYWDTIQNASSYNIYLNGEYVDNTTTTSYTVNSYGSYTVRAVGDGSSYRDSDLSNSVTYAPSSLPSLTAPSIYLEDGVLRWSAVPNAIGYSILLDGSAVETVTSSPYTPTVNGSYTVRALGDGTSYLDSPLSNAVVFDGASSSNTPFEWLVSSADTFLSLDIFGNGFTLGSVLGISFGLILLGFAIKIFLGG